MIINEQIPITTIKEAPIRVACDCCKKVLWERDGFSLPYFKLHYWHNDWDNDSIESHEYAQVCEQCLPKAFQKFIEDGQRTKSLEIERTKGEP